MGPSISKDRAHPPRSNHESGAETTSVATADENRSGSGDAA
jgi:hypothetical protein